MMKSNTNSSNHPKPKSKSKKQSHTNSPNSLGELVGLEVWQKLYNQTKTNESKNSKTSLQGKGKAQ